MCSYTKKPVILCFVVPTNTASTIMITRVRQFFSLSPAVCLDPSGKCTPSQSPYLPLSTQDSGSMNTSNRPTVFHNQRNRVAIVHVCCRYSPGTMISGLLLLLLNLMSSPGSVVFHTHLQRSTDRWKRSCWNATRFADHHGLYPDPADGQPWWARQSGLAELFGCSCK